MICKNCHAPLPDNSGFCLYCGTVQTPEEPAPQQPYAAPQQPFTAPQQPYAAPAQPFTAPQQPYAAPAQPVIPEQPAFEPAQPVIPEQPAFEPAQPVIPEQPAFEPAQPVIPEQPAFEPAQPVIPEQPAFEPAQPVIPEQPKAAPVQPFVAPAQPYAAPQQPFAAPEQPFTAPEQPYAAPQQTFTAPQQPFTAPEQPYAAPQQTYAAPQQTYAAPQQPYAAPQAYEQSPMLDKKPKKSKKGLVLGIVGCLLLLLGAAAALIGFNVFGLRDMIFGKKETNNFSSAMEAFGDEIDQLGTTLSKGELGKAVSAMDNLDVKRLAGNIVSAYSINYYGIQTDTNVDADYAWDADQKCGMIVARFSGYDSSQDVNISGTYRIWFDENEYQIAIDGVEGVYSGTYEEMEETLGTGSGISSLFDMLDQIKDADNSTPRQITYDAIRNGPAKEIFDSVTSEREDDIIITTDAGDVTAECYALTWDAQKVSDYARNIDTTSEDVLENVNTMNMLSFDGVKSITDGIVKMLDSMQSAKAYVYDGRVIGFDLQKKDGGATTYVRLLGKDSVLEHMRVSETDSNTVGELRCTSDGSFSIIVTGDNAGEISYDGATGRFTLEAADTEGDPISISGYLRSAGDDGAYFSMEQSMSGEAITINADVSLEVRPLTDSISPLASNPRRISDLSEAEQQKLGKEILAAFGYPVEPDVPDTPSNSGTLAGDYVLVGYYSDGEIYGPESTEIEDIVIRLYDDGSGEWVEDGDASFPLSWFYDVDYLVLVYEDSDYPDEYYTVEGDELYSEDYGGYCLVFRR